MKTVPPIVLACLSLLPLNLYADTWLYDTTGAPAVYVDDSSSTIYLPSGQAVGYVSGDAVYSYSGTQLGWYNNNTLWDPKGYVVAYPATRPLGNVVIQPVPTSTTFVKQAAPSVVTTSVPVVGPQPTYVYEASPVTVPAYFTVQPVQ